MPLSRANRAPLIDVFEALGGNDVDSVPPGGVTPKFLAAHPTPPAIYFHADYDESVQGPWYDAVHPCDAGFIRVAEVVAEHLRQVEAGGMAGPIMQGSALAVLAALLVTAAFAWGRRWL